MTSTAGRISAAPLFQSERQREIVTLTLHDGRVEVSELATRFGVTTETIRRDLSELQEHHVVRRVHGGATPWEADDFEPLLNVRNNQNEAQKQRIASAAIKELPDTGAVIIDSGSTASVFVDTIPFSTTLRYVTNSLLIAQSLAERTEADVIVIGGKVRKNTFAMVDNQAVEAIEPMQVDTVFLSADGATSSRGLSTPYREEAAWKQAIIGSARRVIALIDHTKFDQEHFIRFAEWRDIDVLITNAETDSEYIAEIEASGTSVIST